MEYWRLIPPTCASGQVQMAVDAWLVAQHRRGQSPCLRFYTWAQATLSLGYHQHCWPPAWMEVPGLDLVRRPTGGRAVLHQGDLTYALVMSQPEGRRSVVYRTVCQFLIQGLAEVGMPVIFGAEKSYHGNANCFGTATAADLISVDTGDKRVGSAQLWRDSTLLQHGSILLYPDTDLFQQVFAQPAPCLTLPASLKQLSSQEVQAKLVHSLTQAARDCFNVDFLIAPLRQWEIEQALAQHGDSCRLTSTDYPS